MSEYTPGPWRPGYESPAERGNRMLIRAEEIDGQPYVAICPAVPVGSHEANSLLIAAAPDMLVACREALQCFEMAGDFRVSGSTFLERRNRAIALLQGAVARVAQPSEVS